MIAIEQEDGDIGLRQPAHLLHEEKAGLIVAPVAVIEVAGDDNEVDLVLDRLADEIIEGGAGRGANAFGRGALLPGKSLQGAVEMDIAGMDEAKRPQGRTPLVQRL